MPNYAMIKRAQNILQFIRIMNEVGRRAQLLMNKQAKQAKIIRNKIPGVLDALVRNDRISDQSREKVAEVLADPGKCLDFIMLLAKHRNASEGAPGVGIKTASSSHSRSSRIVGMTPANIDETEAGRVFREILQGGGY